MKLLITQPRMQKTALPPSAPRPKVDQKHAVGWVYFALCGEMIKIGHSRRLAKRLQVLRSSNPEGAELLGVIPGTVAAEQNIHSLFRVQQVRAEWFSDSPALRTYIAEHCDPIEAQRAIKREWAGVTRTQ